MSEWIPLSVPRIKGNEWTYVKECLDTEWVSSVGSFVDRFENEIRRFTGAGHAVACVNGTAALHIALQLAGVKAGDEVLVPTLTFIAPVNAIAYLGAHPVFMDSDRFYNLDPEKCLRFLNEETGLRTGVSYNKRTGRRIAAIVPVHVFGNAANLEPVVESCRVRGIALIEDATEGLGTFYREGSWAGKHVGTIGAIGCLSFNGNKIITTGGGGMILTDDSETASRARFLTTQAKTDAVHFVHDEIGYNYRLTNLQAALGVGQLELLPEFLKVKKRNFDLYRCLIAGKAGLHLADVPPYASNNHWMYAFQIDEALFGMNRDQVMARLEAKKIQARPVWQLNHLQKPYRDCQAYRIEKAVSLHRDTLNLPCSTSLTEAQVATVAESLRI